MKDLVILENNQALTTSLKIAEVFKKRHDNILRDVENIKKDILNFEEMFSEGKTKE